MCRFASFTLSEAVSIFESYANGGLDVISRWIGEVPSDPYGDQAIIAAMQKYGFFDVSDEEKSGPVEIDI